MLLLQFAKIKPAVQPDSGRGLVATADIQPGECVVNVPIAAAIRVYPGCPTVFQIPQNTWEALPWYGQLALTLLHEAHLGPASKWADYIKQLPTAVDVPVLWSDQEVQQLACGYFISQVSMSQALPLARHRVLDFNNLPRPVQLLCHHSQRQHGPWPVTSYERLNCRLLTES